MTDAEKKELEELRKKDTLSDDETIRAAELEELEADAEPQTDEEEFDAAFAEALEDKSVDNDDDDASIKDTDKDLKKEDDADEDDSSIFNRVPDKEDNSEEDDTPEAQIAKLEADLAKEKQRTSSWEGRIEAANRRAKEAEERLKEKEESAKHGQDKKSPDDITDNEALSEFIEEFPSFEEPIRALIRKEGTKIAREIVEAELGKVTPDIRKVIETTEEEAIEKHFDQIRNAHSDYEKIFKSGALQTWIDHQPKFLQPGLNLIVEEGEASEIIEMLDSYKKASKIVSKEQVNKEARSKKLKGLEAVEAQSDGPPKQKVKPKKDDFDGAWSEALKKS